MVFSHLGQLRERPAAKQCIYYLFYLLIIIIIFKHSIPKLC